jgi:hypothetical protein
MSSASAPAYQTEPQIQFLFQLIDEIADGHFQIPRFQRPYVWTEEQCLELFRSIREGTPIGSIMVWRANVPDLRCYDQLGPYKLNVPSGGVPSYVIDGHQRLATLFGALYSPPVNGNLPEQIAYYELRDDFFFFESASVTPKPTWMPLRHALNVTQLIPFLRGLGGEPDSEALIRSADMLSGAFKRYKIPVLPIVTNDLDQVTKTFQRVNSQGTVMSEVHMVAALTWSKTFDLSERISEWKERWLAPQGFGEIDDKVVLYACKAALGLDVYDADVDSVSSKLRQNPDVLDSAAAALSDAVYFLSRHCGIRSPRVLPYEAHLVPLAEAFRRKPARHHDGADQAALVRWFWLLAYSGTRAGLPKLLHALDYMCGTHPDKPTIPMLLPSPLPKLPPIFDFRSARCKTLSLRLAERTGDQGTEWLAREGVEAMARLVVDPSLASKWSSSPANRILVEPQRAGVERAEILAACRVGSTRTVEQQATLTRHAISDVAVMALAQDDWEGFYECRLIEFRKMEAAFVHDMGLSGPPGTLDELFVRF